MFRSTASIQAAMAVTVYLAAAAAAAAGRPPKSKNYELARWLVAENTWGFISTISNGHDSGTVGHPWPNPVSFSDGIADATDPAQKSTGMPYFLMTYLDETPQDIAKDPRGSFSISEGQLFDSICKATANTDDEDPDCSRIVLSGTFVDVTVNGTKAEAEFGLKALYSKHPEMPSWGPPGSGMHDFHVFQLKIESIFFLGSRGGAPTMSVDKYLSTKQPDKAAGAVAASAPPARPTLARPPAQDSAAVARWLVSSTNWGVIATVSNGQHSGTVGNAFGNPQSFSDGIANATDPSQYSTGTPYFLMTGYDETPQDLAKDSTGGFGISEAQILGDVNCSRTALTDPEDPTCSRISFTGKFVNVSASGNATEEAFALQALYSKHPEMRNFPTDHGFDVWKMVIESIFFMDVYPPVLLTPKEYYAAAPPRALRAGV